MVEENKKKEKQMVKMVSREPINKKIDESLEGLEGIERKKVKIVWGGWSCNAGYVHWAYVCEIQEAPDYYKNASYSEKLIGTIGKKLFEAPNRNEIDNPEHYDYRKEPVEFPKKVCQEECKRRGWEMIGYIKMRTD